MRTHSTRRVVGRLIATVAAVAVLSSALPAVGAPATSRIRAAQERADEAQERLDQLAADLEDKNETYLEIEETLTDTKADLKTSEMRLGQAESALDEARSQFDSRIDSMYRGDRIDFTTVLVGVTDFRDLVTRFELVQRISRSDAAVVDQITEAREQRALATRTLENRRLELVTLRRRAAAAREEVEVALTQQQEYLDGLNKEVAALVRQERARQARIAKAKALAAARLAAARAAALRGASKGATRAESGTLGSSHPEVVSIASQYVGKTPYVWGGTTPSGFDCSGLTQYCYAKIGITIPRTSRSQYRIGSFIAPDRLDQLAAGDLVFFGYGGDPNRVHHVGIYAGNGDYIHAPQTGMRVSVSSLEKRIAERGDYVGAVRP